MHNVYIVTYAIIISETYIFKRPLKNEVKNKI